MLSERLTAAFINPDKLVGAVFNRLLYPLSGCYKEIRYIFLNINRFILFCI